MRVRFAPSPTGYLHLGNIRTALFNYLWAKKQNGKFVLRIEDTDTERSKPEYEQAFLEDLRWLGLQWDEGPEVGGEFGPYHQSQRLEIYQKYVNELIRKGKAYYCYVTEEETAEMKRIAKLERRPPRFDNRGRNFTEQEKEKRKAAGIKPTVRFYIKEPQLIMHDLIRGTVRFNLDDMVGDFVLMKADGKPTFHLAVCVDDGLMNITHVIRGEDHLSNTPKHIMLMDAMGLPAPAYGHLSLIHGPGGEPLSKRLEGISVRAFRKQGYLPEGLLNYISMLGWNPGDEREIFSQTELEQLFDLKRVGKSSSNYDPHKLDWMNGEHLRRLSDEAFVEQSLRYLKESGPFDYDEDLLRRILPTYKDNVLRLEELRDRLEILNDEFSYDDPAMIKAPETQQIVRAAILELPNLTQTGEDLYSAFIAALKPKVSVKGKQLFHPIRMVLTGKLHGPELKRFFGELGTERLIKRFQRAQNFANAQT